MDRAGEQKMGPQNLDSDGFCGGIDDDEGENRGGGRGVRPPSLYRRSRSFGYRPRLGVSIMASLVFAEFWGVVFCVAWVPRWSWGPFADEYGLTLDIGCMCVELEW
jgi:hypothetical protein